MKNSTVVILAAAASAATAAWAQQPTAPGLAAKVPFAFHLKDQVMPAGYYQIKPGPSSGSMILADGTGKNVSVTLFNRREGVAAATGKLRFTCYDGSNCFLTEAVVPGATSRMAIPAGKVEAETRRGAGAKVAMVETPLSSRGGSAAE